jgi:hypothetical protein
MPLEQRSPTGGPRTTDGQRENFGGPWRNLDIICNFYVSYTVSLYSDSSSCHRHRIADNNFVIIKQVHFILIKWNFYDHYFIDVFTLFKKFMLVVRGIQNCEFSGP